MKYVSLHYDIVYDDTIIYILGFGKVNNYRLPH